VTVHGFAWRNQGGDVTINWPEAAPTAIQARTGDWTGSFTWSGAEVAGSVDLWEQPLRLAARFPADHWLPESASAVAENWTLPADRLKLAAAYRQVQGGGRLEWARDHFLLSAQLAAVARDEAKSAPPLEAQVGARGDFHGMTVTALHVASPFATADLSEPVTLDFAQGFQAGTARLTLNADLSRQSWVEARGTAKGSVAIGGSGQQDFALEIAGFQVRDFAFSHAAMRGTLQWPQLEITELDLQPDTASRVTGRAHLDLTARQWSGGELQARFGSDWLARWLPAGARWEKGELTASFSGPLVTPAHSGKVVFTQAVVAPLHPVDASVEWHGHGEVIDDFTVHARAGQSTLEASGRIDDRQLRLDSARLTAGGDQPWTLAQPATVTWAPAWSVEGLRLNHADGFVAFAVQRGTGAALQVDARNVASALAQDWITLPGPGWRVGNLHLAGDFASGALAFQAQLDGTIQLKPQSAEVRVRAKGDKAGVQIEELSTVLGDRVVTQATGHLPVAWDTERLPHLRVGWGESFALDAHTSADSPLWATLGDIIGIEFATPVADVRLGGTLERPEGELNVKVRQLAATRGTYKDRLPEVTDLVLAARANPDGLAIDTFSARIDDQEIRAHGKLPLGRKDWEDFSRDPMAFLWQKGEGHIEIADADIAAFARRLPNLLAAQGRMNAKVDLAAGGALSGELHLHNAALRPIDPLGAVQEINADLALVNRELEIKSWSAKLGGEPVELRGTIELPPAGEPKVALELKGSNLPLVRRTGLIVRSDLALAVRTDNGGTTQVSGTVTLHDSVVLADLPALVPRGQSTASRQPPYFAVERPPFDDWTLAVDVRGPRAVKIRTPVVSGVASARFRLSGTLRDPRAVGELTVDEGRVLFPFATFTVLLGAVRLSEADPHHPQVSLNAQSRYHDYLLRLEASGPLEAPHIVLSSTPALDSTEVLLMVTSGQSPETDAAAASSGQRLATLGTYLGQGLLLGAGSDANRIELSSGSQVSRQGRETYEFTYRLDDRWALVGEYDEFDEYNAGIKWRAYYQEGDKHEKK
jgi:translocation and assembly module TamB